jgi:L-ascorbate metabolism protein UlaG (beta-lactamase superfamily)
MASASRVRIGHRSRVTKRPRTFAAWSPLLVTLATSCTPMPRYRITPHHDGQRFSNPGVATDKGFGDLIRWQMNRDRRPWPDAVVNTAKADLLRPNEVSGIAVTWVGHATMLVQLGRANVLTDPIFSERASPVSFAGPKRVRPPGLAYDELPPIHAVVVSHNHYDHMDLATLRELERRFRPVFVVPLGNRQLLEGEGLGRVRELDWWESTRVDEAGLTVHLAPSLHWSARGLGDRREALWGSYFLRADDGHTAYFAGDTGYHDHFRQIREKLGSPDVALLPIGAYEPRWFMKDHHMNPSDAVRAFLDLEARTAVPMHYATFRLTDEGIDEPLDALRQAKSASGVGDVFAPVAVGGTFRVPKAP